MSYAVRNTIIIAAFWALVLGAGFFYLYGHQDSVHQRLLKEKLQKFKKLTELQELERDLATLNDYYARLQEISQGKKGAIASHESPGETYDYILRETKRANSSLGINLVFEKEDSLAEVLRRTYKLSGEGSFADIYRLLWLLENGPVYYDVKSLSISRVEPNESEENKLPGAEARYSISLCGFERKDGPNIAEMAVQSEAPKQLAALVRSNGVKFAAQRPRSGFSKIPAAGHHAAVERPPSTRKSALPEVSSGSRVLAITAFSVIIENEKGKIIKLRKGDKVSGGYLRDIDAQSNQAVFEIENGAGRESMVLTVASKKQK